MKAKWIRIANASVSLMSVDAENSDFRKTIIRSLDCDIFGVNETFFRNNESITLDGYTFFSHNRKQIHRWAKRGSGGVGVFVSNKLLEVYQISEFNF